MAVLHITSETFEQEVLKSDKPVLLDFWADWCGPCKMLMPIIEDVAADMPDAKICKINVDEEPDLASKYKIMSIPTLMVVKNGEVVKTEVGVQSKSKIKEMLEA
ncbi:MAG: thioredoxin [Lachnospiraceae bacterium]|nr:thioredoxin [Lachnospiraceae bacterium]